MGTKEIELVDSVLLAVNVFLGEGSLVILFRGGGGGRRWRTPWSIVHTMIDQRGHHRGQWSTIVNRKSRKKTFLISLLPYPNVTIL